MDSLLITGRPFADESPVGFLLRVAEANRYPAFNWILRLAGVEQVSTLHTVTSVRGLAAVLELDPSVLGGICYREHGLSPKVHRRVFLGQELSRRYLNLKKPRLCVLCL